MYDTLKGYLKKIKSINKLFLNDGNQREFVQHNRKRWKEWLVQNPESCILVDSYSVSETLISYSYFLNILARKKNARIISFSIPAKIKNYALQRVYQSFNTDGNLVTVLNEDQKKRVTEICNEILPSIQSKQDLLDLQIFGVSIGIDVYETYLRAGIPTVNLNDKRLVELIRHGVGLLIFWLDYFANNKVAAVVVSHDCYLIYNIICKVAYKNQVPVYLPNVRGLFMVTKPFHTYSFMVNYRKMFKALSPKMQAEGVAYAKSQLQRRFNGEVGIDMAYSTESAFKLPDDGRTVLKKSNRIKVLICSHCFFDNPHAYDRILFADFYEWLCFLGKIAERTNYDWYVKVHPDPLPGTIDTIKNIISQYPAINMIPYDTSHHQLVKEGVKFVLTAYGSVGHEYPALGVQVINAGYNPRIAYDFNWHPKSVEEYEDMLLNLDKLHNVTNMNELYEFYYMHHHYVIADNLFFTSYARMLNDLTTEERIDSTVYKYFIEQLTDDKHREIIYNVERFIDSGKNFYFELEHEK